MDAETPFFLAELRKRVFISAYGRDKQVASFLGRPPRLSYRYCKMDVPLDLSDEQLFLEGPELTSCLLSLDEDGWNTTGNLYRTTWQRVWFQHCRVREDILEIALGSGDDDMMPQNVEQIRVRLERINHSFPDFMRLQPEDYFDENKSLPIGTHKSSQTERSSRQTNALFTLCIHAGVAHTEFLLLRALVNRRQKDTKDLIPISRRLLQLVLLSQSKRDFFSYFQGDLTYLVSSRSLYELGYANSTYRWPFTACQQRECLPSSSSNRSSPVNTPPTYYPGPKQYKT